MPAFALRVIEDGWIAIVRRGRACEQWRQARERGLFCDSPIPGGFFEQEPAGAEEMVRIIAHRNFVSVPVPSAGRQERDRRKTPQTNIADESPAEALQGQ